MHGRSRCQTRALGDGRSGPRPYDPYDAIPCRGVSDERRRRLEREAAAGDLAARAALLAERVRVGELAADRLELAAHLGDPAAAQALGREPLGPPTITMGRWVRGLHPGRDWAPWAREAFARAAAAAGRATLGCFGPEARRAATSALEALDAWIACPCDEHAAAASQAGTLVALGPPGPMGLFAARGTRFAGPAVYKATTVALATVPANVTAGEVAMDAARATSTEAVRAAIRDALVPWALR